MVILQGWVHELNDIKKIKKVLDTLRDKYAIHSNIFGMNGMVSCNFFTCRNHLGLGVSKLIEELSAVSKRNHDMYGLIYLNDDEDKEFHDTWQVWIIRKGKIEKTTDTFLSPLSEKVFDYSDDDENNSDNK